MFRMTARLSETDLALKAFVAQQISRDIQVVKYKFCPPPLVSRVLLSWQLVDPYLYESTNPTTVFYYQRM